jgi:hypothetical protein
VEGLGGREGKAEYSRRDRVGGGDQGDQGIRGAIHCWMRAFCDSLTTNCCRSFFSTSDIWEMSMLPLPRESIFAVMCGLPVQVCIICEAD